jgi:AcrR family transcriptional regulator
VSSASIRRSPDAFFAAAYGLLGEVGHTGLTVAALCGRLDVSKGSFYYHFGDMPSFVDRFASCWRAWADQLLINMAAQPGPHRRLEFAANEAFVVTSPAMQAMRAWAVTNPTIADAIASPHRICRATTIKILTDAAEHDDSARILATMGNAGGIGVGLRLRRVERERYVHLVALLYRACGVQTDLLRFGGRARLKVVSLDGARSLRVDSDPLPTDDVPATPSETREGRPGLRGARRAKDDYFLAAHELLGVHGAEGLTITGLVDKLNLSAGSFQHHFGSMSRFVEEFAARRERIESNEIEGFLRERNPWRRMELLNAELLIDPDPADTAWRAWGHTNPVVGAAIRRVDNLRERALTHTIGQLVDSPDSAALAELTMGLAIGLHQWHPPFGPALRARTAVEWMRRVVGIDAEVWIEDGLPRLAFGAA